MKTTQAESFPESEVVLTISLFEASVLRGYLRDAIYKEKRLATQTERYLLDYIAQVIIAKDPSTASLYDIPFVQAEPLMTTIKEIHHHHYHPSRPLYTH